MRRIFLTVGVFWWILSSTYAEPLGLVHERTFSIPSVTPYLQQVSFRDITGDSVPELLLLGDSRVVVFDPVHDSTIVQYDAALGELLHAAVLDDMDGDDLADLVVGSRRGASSTTTDSSLVLTRWFDGASQFSLTRADTIVTSSPAHSDLHLASVLSSGAAYTRLVLSFDSANVPDASGYYTLALRTKVYALFPDEAAWAENIGVKSPVSYVHPEFGRLNLLTTYWEWGGGNVYFRQSFGDHMALVTDSGTQQIRGGVRTGWSCPFSNSWSDNESQIIYGVGQIDAGIVRPTALTVYSWYQSCGQNNPMEEDSAGQGVALFEIIAADSVEVVWQNEGQQIDLPLFHSSVPGYFFGMNYGELCMYRGNDGVAISCLPVVDGLPTWSTNFPDSLPRFITYTDSTVSIYHLDISTDIDDQSDGSLPKSFSLGAPYPNPFNGSIVLPISNDHRQHVRVDIVNMLGQKIATVFDDELAAGEKSITWNAEDRASGVYFIRATTDLGGDTKKVIYLK